MTGVIEAIHIYDERNSPILSHTYTSRPLSAAHLLPLYLEHPQPRPSLIYLPNTNPPTLVFSLEHANLLLLLTTSSEVEPLLALEFLHRVVDALEEFLGAPLLASKIESAYDVAAQLLTELCDAGTVATTEPNALRDLVEVEGWVGRLLGGIALPGGKTAADFGRSPSPGIVGIGRGGHGLPSLGNGGGGGGGGGGLSSATLGPALPWRRANVRHTSNELYADVVESLSVTLAPSGRPLSALASGTIAFTSKVSGVPDVLLSLTGPAGKHELGSVMELPVFHPCVRLARWRERPGELSFVPPDGRFVLAGYEVDLLPSAVGGGAAGKKLDVSSSNNLRLPVNIEVKTGLGPAGADFEVRLHVNRSFGTGVASSASAGGFGRGGGSSGLGRGGVAHAGTPAAPLLEDVVVSVPLPAEVRNLPEIRPTKGDATYSPGDRRLEWHIPAKELASGTSFFMLRCTVAGPPPDDEDEDGDGDADPNGLGFRKDYALYDEPYQADVARPAAAKLDSAEGGGDAASGEDAKNRDARRAAQNRMLMPGSASVSFAVKGWLPSGIKVESIVLDPRRSRGLGEGVKPYKGVKYLTVSKGGVEIRC
ncbi:Adaptor complexes medium subunit family protein [Pleurostoma richardsiae]|uniref:Adaptor complexes medium subunit family protein n=1 Tax=Pleurostoma richardsiae TaxID=41990 RepID=A0AA38S5H1_9PEZI|nr:Adaptor complexes medium subunit family protein [Pleurostoma richardsiae]